MLRNVSLALTLTLVGCGSGEGDGSMGCPELDTGGPTFAPESAKSGESVVATFPLEPGSPRGSCPIEISLTCGAKYTTYEVNLHGTGATDPLELDCAGEAGLTQCNAWYDYVTPNGGTIGHDQGPSCQP